MAIILGTWLKLVIKNRPNKPINPKFVIYVVKLQTNISCIYSACLIASQQFSQDRRIYFADLLNERLRRNNCIRHLPMSGQMPNGLQLFQILGDLFEIGRWLGGFVHPGGQ